jgi:hypothetical protein
MNPIVFYLFYLELDRRNQMNRLEEGCRMREVSLVKNTVTGPDDQIESYVIPSYSVFI